MEIVRDIVARGEPSRERKKVVIFSQFTSMLDLIEIPLARHGWAFRRYDGTMKPADRHAATVHFATNPNCLILLVSMKASNSGLNLTAASQVIILDPFWNPYVEDQAIGRVHRIGQRRPVHVHRILVSNTVEDRILDFQDRKRQLIEGIVDHRTHGEPSRLESTDFAYLFVSSGDLFVSSRGGKIGWGRGRKIAKLISVYTSFRVCHKQQDDNSIQINGQTQPSPKKSQVDGLKAGTLKRRSVPAPIKQTKQAWRWYREQQCDRNCQKDTLAPRHGPPRSSFAMQLSAF